MIDPKDALDDSELSPRRLFTEKENEDDFDDLLLGNIAVGLKLGPTDQPQA